MTEQERYFFISGLMVGSIFGYAIKKVLVFRKTNQSAKKLVKLYQEVNLHVDAIDSMIAMLDEGNVDAAIDTWNQHVDFMNIVHEF